MILGKNVGSVFSEGREIKKVYSLGKLVWEKTTVEPVIDYSSTPFTIKALEDGVGVICRNIGYNYTQKFKFSINGEEWKNAETDSKRNLKKNETISIKSTDAYYYHISGAAEVYGNIMSLVYGDDFIGKTKWERSYSVSPATYPIGFFDESDIQSAKNLVLPATSLSSGAYECMFLNCTKLTTPPKLISKNLSSRCYWSMFEGCSSLTSAPELPATTLTDYCYTGMFGGCTSLNYIKCYATGYHSIYVLENGIGDCIGYWTNNVSPTGTLVCYEQYANELKQYIPDTWTIEYID